MAEPEVPELKPRFEFRFSGPAPVEQSRFRRLARHAGPQSVSDAADQWAGYRYARPEDEYQDAYGDYVQSYDEQQDGESYQGEPRNGHQHHDGRHYEDRPYDQQAYDNQPYDGGHYDARPYDGQYYDDRHYDAQAYDDGPYDDEYDNYDGDRRYPAVSNDFWAAQQAGYARNAAGEYDEPEGSALAKSLLRRARGGGAASRRTGSGSHRLPAPPAALKGRAAVLAVAAGAVVAAGQSALAGVGTSASTDETSEAAAATSTLAAPGTAHTAAMTAHSGGPQVIDIAQSTDRSQFADVFTDGKQLAKYRALREESQDRPLFTLPVRGATFTSGFGVRWGAMHSGVDMAAPIGTPIYAVEDGTVISAGPASGFGMWVRLQHSDGTITVYGHVNTATVSVGQHVEAGDQIATVGNRGYSTGPHCHFEVWQGGVNKIDPLPWLASRGISLGPEED